MEGSFRLAVLTPKATVFEGVVGRVEASGFSGEFGVMPGHYAYITSVTPGALHFKVDGQSRTFAVGDGFAQFSADKVSIVVSSCVAVEDLDRAEVLESLAAAEAILAAAEKDSTEASDASVDQALATGRLLALDHVASGD